MRQIPKISAYFALDTCSILRMGSCRSAPARAALFD
jgi:hypothetical protein